jgi:hypothetical protein
VAARVAFPVLAKEHRVHLVWLESVPASDSFLPIAPRLVKLVSDPDTVEAMYIAAEAALTDGNNKNIGDLRVSLDELSYSLLETNQWFLNGDSLGLAVYLHLCAASYPELSEFTSVIASGALRKTEADILSVGHVAFIKEKIDGALSYMQNQPKCGIVLPMQQVDEVIGLSVPPHCQVWGMTQDMRLESVFPYSANQKAVIW